MKRAALSAFVALVIVCPVVAQKPITPPPAPDPPSRSKVKSSQFDVAVKGCIRGNRLQQAAVNTADPQFEGLRASEFILEGPGELMQQIRRGHDGHYDEIAGIVTVPPPPPGSTGDVSTKKLGPVSIKMGTRSESGPVRDAPRPLRLRVAALTHVADECVARP